MVYYNYIERKPTYFKTMNFKALLATLATAATIVAPTGASAFVIGQHGSCGMNVGADREKCVQAVLNGATATPTAPAAPTAPRYLSGEQALLNSIKNAGVTVSVNACPDGNSYGWFSYRKGSWSNASIQICTNVATNQNDQWETLRHEAVHVAQKCNNPSHGNNFETLTTWSFIKGQATDSDANFVMNNYPEAKWLIEIEAFTFMKKSNQTVANLVNEACN